MHFENIKIFRHRRVNVKRLQTSKIETTKCRGNCCQKWLKQLRVNLLDHCFIDKLWIRRFWFPWLDWWFKVVNKWKTSCITNQARDLLGRSNVGTDRRTNQPTDEESYRGACSRLKTQTWDELSWKKRSSVYCLSSQIKLKGAIENDYEQRRAVHYVSNIWCPFYPSVTLLCFIIVQGRYVFFIFGSPPFVLFLFWERDVMFVFFVLIKPIFCPHY
jgi:hypothetical protein